MPSKTNNITITEDTLLTRTDVCNVLHCGLSSLTGNPELRNLKRIRIGRHTFFLKEDVMNFILSHREGGNS